MKFHHYASIENTYQDKFIKEIHEFNDPAIICVATEKIHGSNLSFIFDGTDDIRIAKRSSFIEKASLHLFNRADLIYEKYAKMIPELFQITKTIVLEKYNAETTSMHLYSEIFGGYYPFLKK